MDVIPRMTIKEICELSDALENIDLSSDNDAHAFKVILKIACNLIKPEVTSEIEKLINRCQDKSIE